MLLKLLDGLSTQEIARKTGVSKALVRKRLSRGLERLRAVLNPTLSSRLFGLGWLVPLPFAGSSSTQLGVVTMGTTQTTLVAGASLAGLAITAAVLTSSPVEPDAELRNADLAIAPTLEGDLGLGRGWVPEEIVKPLAGERAVAEPKPQTKPQPAESVAKEVVAPNAGLPGPQGQLPSWGTPILEPALPEWERITGSLAAMQPLTACLLYTSPSPRDS